MIKRNTIFWICLAVFFNATPVFAFDREASASDSRIESILKLPEVILNTSTMFYSAANIPYYQITSAVVYDADKMAGLNLPKPNKKYIYPVRLSDPVMEILNQLELQCDEMDKALGDEKTAYIRKIAALLTSAEQVASNEDLAIIRGFDQIDYAYADLMYNIDQLDADSKKSVVYELADIFHQSNLKTKIALSKAGSYDVGLLEKHLGFFLAYYGAEYNEAAFADTFRYHSASEMFIAGSDDTITLDETVYTVNQIYAANEAERQRIKGLMETPDSSIFENDAFTSEQILAMESELNRQAVNAEANTGTNATEYKMENGICYEYRYKIVDGETVVDKKWKLKEEEQYYCIGGLDGTAGVPGGLDSMAIHRASKNPDYQSKLIESSLIQQYLNKLAQNVLIYEHKNQLVETGIPFDETGTFLYIDIYNMFNDFARRNGYTIYEDGNKFVIIANNNAYNFYLDEGQLEFEFSRLKELSKGLLLLNSQEKTKIGYEDFYIEKITDLKSIHYNGKTIHLSDGLIYQDERVYISEKEFIKSMRVEYANLDYGYLLKDYVLNTIILINTNTCIW